MNVIEMRRVSKTYPRALQAAVQNIDLEIQAGERLGLIGANGSGKTTLMRLLMNFVRPDEGEIYIRGEKNLEKARRYVGFVPERQEGMENFTPRELLGLSARMHRLEPAHARRRIDELLEFAEIRDVCDYLLSDFSKGMAQRVQICLALIHEPQILLLDEPLSGLDPGGQKDVRDLLARLEKLTVIYASHQLEEIETFCSSVAIIHRGRLVRRLSLASITQGIYTLDLPVAARPLVEDYPGLRPGVLQEDERRVQIQFTCDSATFQQFIDFLSRRQIDIIRVRSRSVLEDLYHRYVSTAERA